MPLYEYAYLEVICFESKRFRVDQMREAVEYLRKQPDREYMGLVAVTHYKSKEPRFGLQARAFIHLKDLAGLTPNKVWKIFDAEVTKQVRYLEGRLTPRYR